MGAAALARIGVEMAGDAKTHVTEPPPKGGAQCRILEQAIRLFCEHGYEATSVRQIVEAAGVTKPVLYYYYKKKEELFLSIIRSAFEIVDKNLEKACAAEDLNLEQSLRAINGAYADFAQTHPDLVRFVHAVAFSQHYDNLFDFVGQWRISLELIGGVFVQAQEAGELRTDVPAGELAFHYMSAVLGAMRALVYCPDLVDTEAIQDAVVRLFLEGVQAKTDSK